MNKLAQDLRYAFRVFARNPGFALAAMLSLALGIGANTAIFSVTNALLLQPLPYQDADRLTILWNRSPGLNITQDWFSTAQYFDIKTGHHGFEQLALAIGGNSNLTGAGEPERVGTIRISSNLLPMLGVRPAAGRLFVAEEDAPGRGPTALLSHGMWERRFGSDKRVIGKSITLNGQSYEVVGILPQSFSLPLEVLPTLGGAEEADILLPLPLNAAAPRLRTREDYNILGKLKRGVSLEQARAEMATITARLRRDYPESYPPNGGLTFGIVPLLEQVVGDVRRPLYILLGAVGFVLLVACANVANLLLARAVGRQKEIAVRAAFGAGRWQVVQQLLTESVVLALCGGGLGILFALWGLSWMRWLGPQSIPRPGKHHHRRAGAAVHTGGLAGGGSPFRSGAGAARVAGGSEHGAERGWPRFRRGGHVGTRAPSAAPAGGFGIGALRGAAYRRRAVDSQLRQAAERVTPGSIRRGS